MVVVDEEDYLKVAGQDVANHVDGPALEGLGQDSVVGVGAALLGDLESLKGKKEASTLYIRERKVPYLIIRNSLLINENPHELWDGQGRVGVVQLDGHLLRHLAEVSPSHLSAAELRVLEAPDHILQGGRAQEILLLQAELLAAKEVVVGVEHPGDVLSQIAVQHGLHVVTIIN